MRNQSLFKRISAFLLSAGLSLSSIVTVYGQDETINPTTTYTGGGMTFEKISHADSGLEQADGIVDYTGNGSISEYVSGTSALGNGDRGQSYSYASASYGDWIYINTMYGGLGVSAILNRGMGVDADVAKAMMDVMYNGNLYTGEPDSSYAGGVLLKFNVKTGETKILMSRNTNGIIPTFRNAMVMNNKIYFVGMVIDMTRGLTAQEIATGIQTQSGFPCIYEIDPENDDKMTCIYDCVDLEGYRELVRQNVFTSTRAVGTFNGAMIAGCLDTNGVFLTASKDPSAGQSSFSVIATEDDLYNYPAYQRGDVNGGGGIYQVIEYNNALYVVICTGSSESIDPETGTLKTFAIVKGTCNGDVTDKSAWKWTVLAGDTDDGAKYPFGLDEERVSCGAATLDVYDGYLYIGEYNDVASALQGFVLRKDFTTQATNLNQSINLYRMDANENIELVVGDPTTRFPSSLTGLGSGYTSSTGEKLGTHMNQYTWQTEVYNGKLYVSTMDTTTLLEPIAQFTNGDLLEMSREEWKSQINYIRVLIELLLDRGTESYGLEETVLDEESARELVNDAIECATYTKYANDVSSISTFDLDENGTTIEEVTLTEEQIAELVSGLLDGSIVSGQLSEETMYSLEEINAELDSISDLVETTDIESFYEVYSDIVEKLKAFVNGLIPENLKALYEMLAKYTTKDNLLGLIKSIQYLKTSEAGFDLFEITDNSDGSVSISAITTNGFGDRYNHGLRIFEKTEDYWIIGTANPFYGTQLWRTENVEPKATSHSITVSVDGEGGTASATPTSAVEGTTVTLTATPNTGYKFTGWEVVSGGVTISEANTFSMPDNDVVIKAKFVKDSGSTSHSITVNVDGEGGTASATPNCAEKGTTVKLTATPNTGYKFAGWKVVNGDVTISNDQFTMPDSDVEITATFTKESSGSTSHSITVNVDGEGGTASATPNSAEKGTTVTLKATPNTGYKFAGWKVVSGDVTISNDTFTMPDTDVVITASFTKDTQPTASPTTTPTSTPSSTSTPSATSTPKSTSTPSAPAAKPTASSSTGSTTKNQSKTVDTSDSSNMIAYGIALIGALGVSITLIAYRKKMAG